MKRRYSYTFSNASRFLPIYDQLIDQVKNNNPVIGITVPVSKIASMDMAPATFQQRLVDGLKYISEKHELITDIDLKHAPDDYVLLKAKLKTDLQDTCLLIGVKQNPTFFSSVNAQLNHVGFDGKIVSAFKQQVLDFLLDKEKPVAQFNNIAQPISPEDLKWLTYEVEGSLKMGVVWGNEGKSLTIVK